MRTADWTDSVTVLDRLTAVLEAFGDDDAELGVTELARRANLPKSTVSRIAADLTRQGCLDHLDGRLGLGAKLFELGNAVEGPRVLREAALPVMAGLREAIGQTVYVAVVEGMDVVTICIVRSRSSQASAAAIGMRRPADASPYGRTIFACATRESAERVAGAAVERSESTHRGTWVASPIVGAASEVLAVLAIDVAGAHINSDDAALDVRAAALAISRRLTALRSN